MGRSAMEETRMNRTNISALLCGVTLSACDLPPPPPRPTPEEIARAKAERDAATARAAAEQRFRQHVERREYLIAANAVLSDHLFGDGKRASEIAKLLGQHAGTIEGANAPDRCLGYSQLARFAKRVNLDHEVAQRYAASALHACVVIENLDVVANGALLAKEFNADPDLQWRAAARVWSLRIKESGWPNQAANAQAFVNEFPLSGSLANAAYAVATERGDWNAARLIAERGQLPEEQFRAARGKEIEELVATAIRARDDQRLLQLNLEAPGYVDASVVRTVAARVVAELIEKGQPGEAYSLAITHGLPVEDAKRAADAFFAAAIKVRKFSMARVMPDGTLIIVERPPAPAPAASPAPTTQFEGGGGHGR